MGLKEAGKKVFRLVDDASSSTKVPTIVAGLAVAIAAVKLVVAIGELRTILGSSRRVGFTMEN